MLDPIGNAIAIAVLFVMIFILAESIFKFKSIPSGILSAPQNILIPILCIIGLGIAGYLAFVEITQAEAICGPIGDCNTVQQSTYARLFGLLPIGVLGVIGYLAILLAWGVARSQAGEIVYFARITLLGLSIFGLIFSIYLTFLEPFVIGATCGWCITSAIIMTVIFRLTTRAANTFISPWLLRNKA